MVGIHRRNRKELTEKIILIKWEITVGLHSGSFVLVIDLVKFKLLMLGKRDIVMIVLIVIFNTMIMKF
jgi:hypothetical protein